MGLVGPAFPFIYFAYGLAFFSLGMSLLLEAKRMPSPAARNRLLPLSVFGLLHGSHEWLEFFAIQNQGGDLPPVLEWTRLALLAISFASLLAYGVKTLPPAFNLQLSDPLVETTILLVYSGLLALLSSHPFGSPEWFADADALARMVIAVPAGLLAFMALRKRSHDLRQEDRTKIARCQIIAASGFFAYSFTQIFVSKSSVLYAPYLNTTTFIDWLGFPIQIPRTIIAGLIAVAIVQGTQASEEERQLELQLARQARFEALEQARIELSKKEALQREITRNIVMAQEDERRRISRELHDETAQALTALGLTIAAIQNQAPHNEEVTINIQRAQEINRQLSRSLKRLVHQLRPAQLDDLGLIPALQYLVGDASANLKLNVKLTIGGVRKRLDGLIETVLFRVSQEGLTNIARHAETNEAEINLEYTDLGVQLNIIDRGVGFDLMVDHLVHGHSGLAGMQERVEAIGGTFTLSSSPGTGTRIDVFIPQPAERSNPQ